MGVKGTGAMDKDCCRYAATSFNEAVYASPPYSGSGYMERNVP